MCVVIGGGCRVCHPGGGEHAGAAADDDQGRAAQLLLSRARARAIKWRRTRRRAIDGADTKGVATITPRSLACLSH